MDQNQYPQQPRPYVPQPYPYPQAPGVDAPVHWGPTAPDGRPLAGAGQRFGARVIDNIITIVLIVIPFAIAIPLGNLFIPDDSPLIPIIMITTAVIAFLVIPYLYDVEYPLRYNGQTPGKRFLKITVTPLQPGVPLTRGIMVKRWLLIVAFNILAQCYIGLIDPLWLLWDKPYRQCLHDKWPRTCVVRLDLPA